jgi:hypothetical protein
MTCPYHVGSNAVGLCSIVWYPAPSEAGSRGHAESDVTIPTPDTLPSDVSVTVVIPL